VQCARTTCTLFAYIQRKHIARILWTFIMRTKSYILRTVFLALGRFRMGSELSVTIITVIVIIEGFLYIKGRFIPPVVIVAITWRSITWTVLLVSGCTVTSQLLWITLKYSFSICRFRFLRSSQKLSYSIQHHLHYHHQYDPMQILIVKGLGRFPQKKY